MILDRINPPTIKQGKRKISRSPVLDGVDLAAGNIIPITGDCRACAVGDVLQTISGVVLITMNAVLDEVAVGIIGKSLCQRSQRSRQEDRTNK